MTVLSLIVGLLFVLAPPSSGGLNMLFGVPVPPGFRSTEPARRALRSYLLLCTIPLAAWLLGLIFLRNLPVFSVATQLAFVVVAVVAFVVQNRRLKPYAVQPPLVREFDLSQPERLPSFTWLGIPPLALLAGIAVYLRSHWDQLPARYPAYLPLSGTPDQWDDRTVRSVYGPLILAGEIAVWMFVLALAIWYGSRRTEPLRKPAMVVMLAVEWFVVLTMGISRPTLARRDQDP